MSKKSDEEMETKVRALRDRLNLVIRFFEETHDFPSGPQVRAIVETAAEKLDLRTLRLVNRDIDAMTIALTPRERATLDSLLRDRLGVALDSERLEIKQEAAAAVARGTVASEKQRRRLEDYAEMLEATGGDADEIRSVRRVVNKR
ncbi:MAG TPA: hypothetical protein VN600_07695 [Gemmatimonadaceae bacterium]|nr:hypothetical protein [Gemmatimonadaceae bacterium]